MPIFRYKARDLEGNLIEGIKEAETKEFLVSELKKESLFPITVREEKPFLLFKSKDKFIEKFTFQISSLLNSGFELPKALDIISSQVSSSWEKALVIQIRKGLSQGKSFWEVLLSLNLFSGFYLSMVKAGESTANLGGIFKNLALYYEEAKELREKIASILIYPLILSLVGLGTVIFLISYVLPKMLSVFENLKVQLPLITRVFIRSGEFFSKTYKIIILLVLGLFFFLKKVFANERLRERIDKLLLKLPFLGFFIEKVNFANFSKILSLALGSGLPLIEALTISEGVLSNKAIVRKLKEAKLNISKGSLLSEALRKGRVFSPQTLELIVVAEESGKLEEFLLRVSRNTSAEVKAQIERFLRILEPLSIFILALIVGFLVMAILLPIFQVNLQVF